MNSRTNNRAGSARSRHSFSAQFLSMICGRAVIGACIVGLALVGPIGCQKRSSPFPTEEQLNNVRHTVKTQGETLFAIAAWYTGQGMNWKQLVDANPGLNPNKMKIGDVIHIPRRLVLRVDPMPSSAGSANSKRSVSTTRSSADSRGRSGATRDDSKDSEQKDSDQNGAPDGSVGSEGAGAESAAGTASSLANELGNTADASANSAVSAASSAASEAVGTEAGSTSSVASSVDAILDQATQPVTAPSPTIEKRTKSRDELLQELLKDY